jgi:O-antigen/teichoic acid export membrane protein
MSTTRKVISNTFYLFLDSAVVAGFGYLFWIILGKMLSPGELGSYSTIMNISLLITAFTAAGFARAGIKLISEYVAKNKKEYVSGFIWWATKMSTIVNFIVIFLLVGYILILPMVNYLNVYMVVGIILYIFFNTYYVLTSNYLVGLQKMKTLFNTNLVSYGVKVLSVIVFISLGWSYFGALGAFILSAIVAVVFRIKSIPFASGKIDFGRNIKYLKSAMVLDTSMVVLNSVNVFILSILTDMYSVGIFTFAFMFSAAIRLIPTAISTSIMSIGFSHFDIKKIKLIVARAIKYSFIIILPIISFLFVFSEKIIIILSNTSYLESVVVMQILLFGSVFIGVSMIISFALYSIGKIKSSRNILFIGAVVNVLLTILMVKEYTFIGAAVSFTIASIIMSLLAFYYLKKHIKLKFQFREVFKISIASILPAIVVFFVSNGNYIGFSRAMFLPVYLIVYAIMYLLIIKLFSVMDLRDKEFILVVEDKVPKKMRKDFRKLLNFYFD